MVCQKPIVEVEPFSGKANVPGKLRGLEIDIKGNERMVEDIPSEAKQGRVLLTEKTIRRIAKRHLNRDYTATH